MIKLSEESSAFSANVFDIEKHADEAFEILTELAESNKISIIWRDK